MRDINLYNLQLMDLELFLYVAKYGSFTKAGDRMFMTQSRVSKRIDLMEQELGLQLFIRNKRKVVLTPAGRVLEQRFSKVTDDIFSAIQEAHTTQMGMSGYLKLGFLEWSTIIFMDALEKFTVENPQISVDIFRNDFKALRNHLFNNQMDLIFTMSYDTSAFNEKEYSFLPLTKTCMAAYINRKNPLSQKKSLCIKDLQAEYLLMLDQKSSPGYCSYIMKLFNDEQIHPLISHYSHSGGEHIGNVLMNKGILLASDFFMTDNWGGQIVKVPLEHTEVHVTGIWKTENTNPALKQWLTYFQ